ncbi:MAG: type II toxin-antitoxin system HicB family antitoxin [Candidatus Neomarinimicrobiota bacterium]
MTREYDVLVERDADGYYVASVPALHGCHTQAKTLDELMARIQEAIALCLEVEGEPPETLDFVGVQRVSVTV